MGGTCWNVWSRGPPAAPPHAAPQLTIFPVLEGRGELFGSDPGDPCFLLGLLSRGEGCLGLGPGVGGPGWGEAGRAVKAQGGRGGRVGGMPGPTVGWARTGGPQTSRSRLCSFREHPWAPHDSACQARGRPRPGAGPGFRVEPWSSAELLVLLQGVSLLPCVVPTD